MRAKQRFLQSLFGMIAYLILLPLSIILLDRGWVTGNGRYLIALLPMLPFAYIIWISILNVRDLDELQQRIHLEAVLIAALLMGGFTFSYGLLASQELLPPFSPFIVGPGMMMIWGIATNLIGRRYDA